MRIKTSRRVGQEQSVGAQGVHDAHRQGDLLHGGIGLVKLNVNDYLAVFLPWFCLESYAQPAMSFVSFGKIYGGYRIGITKEKFMGVFFTGNALFNK